MWPLIELVIDFDPNLRLNWLGPCVQSEIKALKKGDMDSELLA